VLAIATAIGVPALAASGGDQSSKPSAAPTDTRSWDAQRAGVIDHDLVNAKPLPKPKPRPVPQQASRSSFRAPLSGSPREIARQLVLARGWSETQYGCLSALWDRESGWNVYSENGSSGAYGIPQALPGYKMAMFGSDWRTNAVTQIKWGLWYIADRYGTPCNAYAHSNSYNYY
jgi:hypothetical protein